MTITFTPLRLLFAFIFAGLFTFATSTAIAQTAPVFNTDGVAIQGYDPVAYFTIGEPVEGDPAHTTEWNEATWQFANAEHKALFDADPEKYAPKYGGYCAYAVSKGYTANTVPEAWSIVDGALYLNYSTGVRRIWERDKAGYIASSDANWPEVLN